MMFSYHRWTDETGRKHGIIRYSSESSTKVPWMFKMNRFLLGISSKLSGEDEKGMILARNIPMGGRQSTPPPLPSSLSPQPSVYMCKIV